MQSPGSEGGSKRAATKDQRHNRQTGGLGSVCRRLFAYATLCYVANRSATNVVNVVNAVNSDKVSFQVFEIDSPLLDIMWCGPTNDVILVQSDVGTVYRSRDRGDSWKKLHSIMH